MKFNIHSLALAVSLSFVFSSFAGSDSKERSEKYADIYIKSVSKGRIKEGSDIFENGGKKWLEVPKLIDGERAVFRRQGLDQSWEEEAFELKVKEAGNVLVVIQKGSFKNFEGWEKVDTGRFGMDASGELWVIKKHLDKGEYTLPTGFWWFPVIVVYM